jgi:hypothetical protein
MASQLKSLVIRAPGMYGLNFEGETYSNAAVFAEVADNVAYDSSGRIVNRKGFNRLTTETNALGYASLGANPLTSETTAGKKGRVTVTHTAHGRDTGDYVTISGATAVGGLTADQLNIRAKIIKVDANSYTYYTAGEASSATSAGGSNVKVKFEPKVEKLFMYNYSGGEMLIGVVNQQSTYKLYESASPYTSFTDRTASLSFSSTDFQFQNFNDKCIGALAGSTMLSKSGSGDFAAIVAAQKTYTVTTSSVNTDRDTITLGTHSLEVGDEIKYAANGGSVLGGLHDGNIYYVIPIDTFTIKLAMTHANAVAGTAIDLTTTGNNSQTFTETVAAGTVPTGGIVHSAFGRLWAQKSNSGTNKNVISYCALKDETNWGYIQGGEIDVLGTFTAIQDGYDELIAISSFDRYLVAFLRNSIIIYNNPDDPINLGIAQIISGVGCVAKGSIQQIGDDVYFLSATGVRSLRQTIHTGDKAELAEISTLVRTTFLEDTISSPTVLYQIDSHYDPEEGQYWIKSPTGLIWVFDMHSLTSEMPIRITKYKDTLWDSFAYHEGETYIGGCGMVGKYNGYYDDAPNDNTKYICTWISNPVDFGTSTLKFLKKVTATLTGNTTDTVYVTYEFTEGGSGEIEFDLSKVTGATRTAPVLGVVGEWGSSDWNDAEWGGGSSTVFTVNGSAAHAGRALKLGTRFNSSGFYIAVEQLSLFLKLGREGR